MKKALLILFGVLLYETSYGQTYLLYMSVKLSSAQSYSAEIHINVLTMGGSDILIDQFELYGKKS